MSVQKAAWYVYIVACADGTLYTGITTDVDRRLREHNGSSKGAKYTKMRTPVALVHKERQKDRSSASKREHALKTLSRKEKLALIQGI